MIRIQQGRNLKHRFLYIPILLLFSLAFVDCAKKGTPSGGPRDTIPPVIVNSKPENYSINFDQNEIEIRFDEYIRLKDLDKQLFISPPMKFRPVITPFNTSKTLKIVIADTLKPNTTYSFNFGKSIVDNNEGNEYDYFKYVFSTGSYIDSLKVSGTVRDAQLIAPEIPTKVMLYEANEAYTDSLIYSEKPTYLTVTKDSTGYFELSNLKEGRYILVALSEKDNDYTFQPKNDKIGFVDETISVPTDSTYSLTLFKETPKYKLSRPKHVGKNHIVFGYEGLVQNANIELQSEIPANFSFRVFKDETSDTLHYWFKPAVEADSLIFKVTNRNIIDTTLVRMRDLYKDSLQISTVNSGTLKLKDTFKLRANTPLMSIDPEKIEIMTRDSLFMDPIVGINPKHNWAEIYFTKNEDQGYDIKLFPGALTDFFDESNDTLQFNANTRLNSDYGTLNLSLVNANRFPVIVQMVDGKYNMVAEEYLAVPPNNESGKSTVYFDAIDPGKYYLRIIYDDNQNRRWDTGSFLNRLKPEQIIYYPTQIEVRSNWSLNETFILK